MAKILVIDDEKELAGMISMRLSTAGHQVIEAYDGEAGVIKAIESKPELILLDIMMPKMDGFEVVMRLKANDVTELIPVIILTAKSDLNSISRSHDFDIAGYILKPFNPEALIEKVKNTLNR